MVKVLTLAEGASFVKKKIKESDHVFLDARDFYFAHPEMLEDPVTVVDAENKPLYQLMFATNHCGGEIVVKSKMGPSSGFWHYTYDIEPIDDTMLKRANHFIFDEIDEYTYAITRIIRQRFPEKKLFFTDEKAALFFKGESQVSIVEEKEAEQIRADHPGDVMTVVKDGDFLISKDSIRDMTYNSLQMMTGMLWLTETASYGEENPDKKLILIKSHIGHEGIAGVLRYVLNKLEVIKKTGQELYPVVDLGIYGEVNQFANGDGRNVWDMYFEPVSEFSVEDVYNSKNVLLAYDGMKTKNPYLYEQDILADYPGLIKKYLHIKPDVIDFCEKQAAKVVPQGVKNYIGVVGRGSDYNMQLSGKLANYLMRPLSGEEILEKTSALFQKGGYDGIFLATEDDKVFDIFMRSDLKDRIFYVEQERINYDPTDTSKRFLADIYKEEKNRDGYAENLRYISIIYILSRSAALLSTTLCGAAKIAWGLSENGFDYMDVPGIS